MEIYPDKPLGNVLRIAMPRAPRLYAPGGTMHVVARCNNQEFYFTIAGCLNPALTPVYHSVSRYMEEVEQPRF